MIVKLTRQRVSKQLDGAADSAELNKRGNHKTKITKRCGSLTAPVGREKDARRFLGVKLPGALYCLEIRIKNCNKRVESAAAFDTLLVYFAPGLI